ncbi:MAG: hypothetical protein IT362_05140 [Deltaproteobacteria bacterium]|nr:hypothetical protein [Deltaproteobacteria bacterium]
MERECPYIETRPEDFICGASVTSMVPSVSEFTTYCGSEDHYRCPILLARVLREASSARPQRTSSAFCR